MYDNSFICAENSFKNIILKHLFLVTRVYTFLSISLIIAFAYIRPTVYYGRDYTSTRLYEKFKNSPKNWSWRYFGFFSPKTILGSWTFMSIQVLPYSFGIFEEIFLGRTDGIGNLHHFEEPLLIPTLRVWIRLCMLFRRVVARESNLGQNWWSPPVFFWSLQCEKEIECMEHRGA